MSMASILANQSAAMIRIIARADADIQLAGAECKALAQQFSPVDTGRLQASIMYSQFYLECAVWTPIFYAPYQEFGTRFMAAQPFMYPAFALAASHLLDRLGASKV